MPKLASAQLSKKGLEKFSEILSFAVKLTSNNELI